MYKCKNVTDLNEIYYNSEIRTMPICGKYYTKIYYNTYFVGKVEIFHATKSALIPFRFHAAYEWRINAKHQMPNFRHADDSISTFRYISQNFISIGFFKPFLEARNNNLLV